MNSLTLLNYHNRKHHHLDHLNFSLMVNIQVILGYLPLLYLLGYSFKNTVMLVRKKVGQLRRKNEAELQLDESFFVDHRDRIEAETTSMMSTHGMDSMTSNELVTSYTQNF